MRVVFISKKGWLIIVAVCVFVIGNFILLYRFIDKTAITLSKDERFRKMSGRFFPKGHPHPNLFDVAAAVNELQKNRSGAKLTTQSKTQGALPQDEKKHLASPYSRTRTKDKHREDVQMNPEILRSEVKSSEIVAISHQERIFKVPSSTNSASEFVAAVLVIACNRPTVKRCLDLLLKYRPSPAQFPIVVSQDCGHEETAKVIKSYGNEVMFIQQPDLTRVQGVPSNMQNFMGYYKISRHYKWALSETFDTMKHDTVIIVEDDLDIAPDFFEYFTATKALLDKDPTLWCISAWNDNGKEDMVQGNDILYRTDFFPGLGWMIKKPLWDELRPKWPLGFWDDWMREPAQRKSRACIRPEISRTRTFGREGVSQGQFFDQHLKYIKLNDEKYPFTKTDLSYLLKDNYHKQFLTHVRTLPITTTDQLIGGKVFAREVRIPYSSENEFERVAKVLGAMRDFKAGVPRMAYQGVVTIVFKGVRVHIVPSH